MNSMSDACFLGPWEQKRNFSWSAIDQVNLTAYVGHLSRSHCVHMNPAVREQSEEEENAQPETRLVKSGASIKSASSRSSSSLIRNQSDKDNNESSHTTKRTTKPKKKPQGPEMTSLKNAKSSSSTRVQSGLRNKRGSNSMTSLNKFDQINSRIDVQLNQLRSNQRTYEASGEAKRDNYQSNHNQNYQRSAEIYPLKSDTIFGDNLTNYNPSTLYRLKKLQNSDQLNRRQFHSNLIATLDTNCDSARVFDRSAVTKKCACCNKDQEPRSDFVKNLVTKSSSDYCACSDVDSESSEVSSNQVNRRRKQPIQRVKSVVCLRNKNIEFANHAIHTLHVQGKSDSSANKADSKQNAILKINKSNNESKLVALKQFCSASIGINRAKNAKLTSSNPNNSLTSQSEMPTSNKSDSRRRQRARQNSLVKNNNIELELSPDFDNSHSSSARSKIAATPNTPNTPPRNASCYSRQKLPPANNATFYGSSINNARMHIQNLQSKYPETIAISGKSFITNGNVAHLDFQISNTLQPAKKIISSANSKRISSAETEIRDIQIKFNQLTKIGVK